jgi:hypothetical protein
MSSGLRAENPGRRASSRSTLLRLRSPVRTQSFRVVSSHPIPRPGADRAHRALARRTATRGAANAQMSPACSGHSVQDSPRPLNAASYHPTAASVLQFLEGRTVARQFPGGRMSTGSYRVGAYLRARRSRTGERAVRYRRSSNGAALRRPHHMRPGLADSAGRGSATNREQRCAALGAVALPAGTTVGQGHLPRVGDGDPFAADASGVWVGLRRVWVPCARFNHDPGSIFPADWLSRGRCQSTPAGLAGGASDGMACRCMWSLAGDCPGSCHETVTSVTPPCPCTITVKDPVARRDRPSDRGRPRAQGAQKVLVFGCASSGDAARRRAADIHDEGERDDESRR